MKRDKPSVLNWLFTTRERGSFGVKSSLNCILKKTKGSAYDHVMNISLNAIQHPHRPLLPLEADGELAGYWPLLNIEAQSAAVQDPVSRKIVTSRLCALQPEEKKYLCFKCSRIASLYVIFYCIFCIK